MNDNDAVSETDADVIDMDTHRSPAERAEHQRKVRIRALIEEARRRVKETQ